MLRKILCFDPLSQQRALSILLSQHIMQVINCRGITLCAGLTTSLSTDCKSCTLLTFVHNNADAADNTDNYNRVIGIAQLKAFSCAIPISNDIIHIEIIYISKDN